MKRRDALKTIGGLGAAAALARVLPSCKSDNGGPVGITTYVYMMMENRSYDHYFGARTTGDGLPAGTVNLDSTGTPVPSFIPTVDQMCDLDPPHGWDASHAQWNLGKNDGFVTQQQLDHAGDISPMQYMTDQQLPVSWALADAYTVCDRWFASVMGPTWPNRFYWHTGSSGGLMANSLPTTGNLCWPSVYNRLKDAGVDWAYYYGTIPVLSALNDPGPYQLPDDYLQSRVKTFSNFMTDALAGTLPPVVYIDPAFYGNDDHPPIHPINGQELISAVYTALAMSPQWNNIMFVLTYDEHGGFYDHVSPPMTADDYAATGFNQMGFRVPAMVMGPYAKTGYVSSVQYDHTSALKHLQNTFGLEGLSMRSDAAVDLTDCIDMDRLAAGQPNPPIDIPLIDLSEWPMSQACNYVSGSIAPDPARIDPITEWANQNPQLVAKWDLRPQYEQYRADIREFLANARKARGG